MSPSCGSGSTARLVIGGPVTVGRVLARASASVADLTLEMYSGYIVSAPPREARSGMWFSSACSRGKDFDRTSSSVPDHPGGRRSVLHPHKRTARLQDSGPNGAYRNSSPKVP